LAESMRNITNLKISLKSKSDVDNDGHDLKTSVQSALFKFSNPHTPIRINQTNNQTLPFYIRTLISDKRYARFKWQKYRYSSDIQIFSHLTNTIIKLIKNSVFKKNTNP